MHQSSSFRSALLTAVAVLAVATWLRHEAADPPVDLDAEESMAMNDALKVWLDAMPIDDVRGRMERLERKLSDLRVIERLYNERHPDADAQTTSEAAGYEVVWASASGCLSL